MGGSGTYYDRDTTATKLRGSSGFSNVAEEIMSKSNVDDALLPKNRKLIGLTESPNIYAFDVTGSMGKLPKIICDKWPMVVGELARNEYLKNPEFSLAAVGDVQSDRAPIQICDFSIPRSLDEWLSRIWLEGGGGGQEKESYEFTAYFYANNLEIPNAETPTFLFTGDEGYREKLLADELKKHFGGEHESANAQDVFEKLKKKFKGNVFLIHRRYDSAADAWITKQWQEALGKERVIVLPSDLAIADITLGVYALASGSRTLDEYIDDIKSRPLDLGGVKFEPQSPERIREVRQTLEEFATIKFPRKKNSGGKKKEDKSPVKKNKPGRI